MSRTAAEGMRAELESRGCHGSKEAPLDTAWWLVRNGILAWDQLAQKDVDKLEGTLIATLVLHERSLRV